MDEEETEYTTTYCRRCVKETQHIVTSSGRLLCLECHNFNVRRKNVDP